MKKSDDSKKDSKKKKAKGPVALKKPSKLKPVKGKEKKNLKDSLNEEEEFDDLIDPETEDIKLDDFGADGLEDEEDGFYADEF